MSKRNGFALVGVLILLFGSRVIYHALNFATLRNRHHKMTMAEIKEQIMEGETEMDVLKTLGAEDQHEKNVEIYWGTDGVVGIVYEEGKVDRVVTKRVETNPD